MAEPKDPVELALVVKAISLAQNTRGCCEWNERAARRIRQQPPCQGMTPEGIRELLLDHVNNHRGQILQVEERREEYREHRFYYKAIIPVAGLRRGLFVEMVLGDDDPEFPAVEIVNAHEQGR